MNGYTRGDALLHRHTECDKKKRGKKRTRNKKAIDVLCTTDISSFLLSQCVYIEFIDSK